MSDMTIWFVLGTRPEAVKLAPVILSCKKTSFLKPLVIYTSQHQEMGHRFLELFGLQAHYTLPPPPAGRSLCALTTHILAMLDNQFKKGVPDCTIVQGDTTSALCGSLVSFYHRVPVAHVEAGLRTFAPFHPFPEEMNRTIISRIAHLHFAPTPVAFTNLLREGIDRHTIDITGNTVVDALDLITRQGGSFEDKTLREEWEGDFDQAVTVTVHRRESWGGGVRRVALALQELTGRFTRTRFFFSVHPNPAIRREIEDILRDVEGIVLLEPLGYRDFIQLLSRSSLVISDSGGVQEEAPSLGVPVVITREHTERPEVIDAGWGILAGTNSKKIVEAASGYLEGRSEVGHKTMLFGDGRASERIMYRMAEYFGFSDRLQSPPPPPWP